MDFSLILFIFVAVTGVVSLGYRLLFERVRPAPAVAPADAAADATPAQPQTAQPEAARKPLLVEYSRALFPVVLIVFLLRSFVIEPFRIPSGSMLPSLHIGDFILVNKFQYGIRLPILNRKVVELGGPARGDVMVFRYPRDPKLNFVKRVVGLPGDVIGYVDKKLSINGVEAPREAAAEFEFDHDDLRGQTAERYWETTDDSRHEILIDRNFYGRDMQVQVPPGHYFVMGDNRDHSNDSRFWRFVPEENIVGKAFFIWFSWSGFADGGVQWRRIGTGIE